MTEPKTSGYTTERRKAGVAVLSPGGALVYVFDFHPYRSAEVAAREHADWHNRVDHEAEAIAAALEAS